MNDPLKTRAPGETWTPDVILEADEIMRKLQHRYPMLLIDRLYLKKDERRAVGIKNVTVNEPFFQGHFPGNPIMPGIMILECLAQTSALTEMVASEGTLRKDQGIYFVAIDKARFRSPVVPGDVLEMHVRLTKRVRRIWKFEGRALVGERRVAEADCTAALVDIAEARDG